jgi:GT2 family glycosyltransferase
VAFDPKRFQRRHYNLDERPWSRWKRTGCSAGVLLLRRSMLEELRGLDEGFRLYGEDIDLA